jgi:hypothetical protein
MELRTQADRLLESLAPLLTAEMERVLEESRQQMESDFQVRLQTALRDAELATLHLAEVRLEEAVTEAREATRIQLTEGFTEQLNYSLQQLREELSAKSNEDMKAAFANWAAERASLQEQLSRWHAYADAQRQLSQCTSQLEIVARLFKLSEPFAESFAFYVSKPDGLALLKARGNGAFPKWISSDTIDPDFYFKTAVVRDTVVAAICAARPCNAESLDFLVSCFERVIESFGMKLNRRGPTPPVPEKVLGASETSSRV